MKTNNDSITKKTNSIRRSAEQTDREIQFQLDRSVKRNIRILKNINRLLGALGYHKPCQLPTVPPPIDALIVKLISRARTYAFDDESLREYLCIMNAKNYIDEIRAWEVKNEN